MFDALKIILSNPESLSDPQPLSLPTKGREIIQLAGTVTLDLTSASLKILYSIDNNSYFVAKHREGVFSLSCWGLIIDR